MECHAWFYKKVECSIPFIHDVFKIGDYPEDKLHSIMETMRFCVKNNIKLTKEQKYQLQKFWFENPEGLIIFE